MFRRLLSSWQVLILLLAWVYLSGLAWSNDGLWFQGDSPRHAANGLFWKDFLLSLPLSDPKGYALSYYARYPVINPVTYPPGFYLLEGALYGLVSPSPYVAKGLVLAFVLLGAFYTMAWLRRWVDPRAGWMAALLLLLPGVVKWSHAVMLNVPALALEVAALYHARRWIEAPEGSRESRHLYAAAALCLSAILTYATAGVVVFVILAWVLASGRAKLLFQPRTLLVAAGCALLLLPWAALIPTWAPSHLGQAIPRASGHIVRVSRWTFYLRELPALFGPLVLALGAVGLAAGLASRRWRREAVLLLLWISVCYTVYSLMVARSERYVLVLGPPLVILSTVAVLCLTARLGRAALPWGALAVLLAAQAGLAWRTLVPSLTGFRELVAFVEEVAPDESVFYDGYHDGVFSFYLQSRDPDYRRRVVLGSKVLYASSIFMDQKLEQFVSTPREAVEALRARSGCGWILVERGSYTRQVPAARRLREAVEGPEFQLVRSFPISGTGIERVDVYRLLGAHATPETARLPFPILGQGVQYQVKPIER
ncbi:MAG TPA: glycosyltransferase family 39 protein [Thermoanaerobaculia bacterium]|nr:glycosyltransferase family 39 protein [Thermoanaerobaculia bacterium]